MSGRNKNEILKLSLAEILSLPDAEKEKRGLLYTPREIFQQPETWRETFQIVKNRQKDLQKFLKLSGLNNIEKIFVSLIGAGTSDYVGRTLVALLRKNWKCRVEAVPGTDLLTESDNFINDCPANTNHLWISFSRSGDSFESVKVIEKALEQYPQIKHLIVTCNENGKMKKLCNENENAFCLTLDKKVNDLGLAMTSSFTNMIVAGQCLAHIDDLDKYESIVEILSETAADKIPAIAEAAQKVAAQNFTRICFLGSGALKSVGTESALKIMELTGGYFSVMNESFLGLRHGPLSWLNQESLVIAFLSNNPDKSKIEIDLIEELKRKNAAGSILAVLPSEQLEIQTDFQILLNLPEFFDDNYRPPIDVLFAQCLGLFASLHQNLKPDSPSADGKIRRVVSQIG